MTTGPDRRYDLHDMILERDAWIAYSEKLREALQEIIYSGLSAGTDGDKRDYDIALDDAHNLAKEALALPRPGVGDDTLPPAA